MFTKQKKTAGITLMELVVVLAIVAIIGAIVVPNFFGMTGIARLRADIQSTLVLDNAFQLYRLQNPNSTTANQIEPMLRELYEQGFLSSRVKASSTIEGSGAPPQTPDTAWIIVGSSIRLTISDEIHSAYWESLTAQERTAINRP